MSGSTSVASPGTTEHLSSPGFAFVYFYSCRRNNISDLKHWLSGSDFLVWNLSNAKYSYEILENQIVQFVPPLNSFSVKQIFEVCRSIHAYLSLSDSNIAVVHCLNGYSKTSVFIACYMRYVNIYENSLYFLF